MKRISAIIIAAALSACSAPAQNSQPQQGKTKHAAETSDLMKQGKAAYSRRSYTDALTAFTQASAAGNMVAARYIGLIYLHGYGVEQNPVRAAAEFRKAAEAGDAEAQYWLAYCYEQGLGVKTDLDAAAEWYGTAAKAKHPVAASAMTALGRLAEGHNIDEAAAWYRQAASHSDPEAKAALKRLGLKP